MRLCIGLLLLFGAIATGTSAQDCIDYGEYQDWIGSLDLPGVAHHVTVVGNTAYITGADFTIVDITPPGLPTIMATLATPSNSWAAEVVGATAYVADGNSGLLVVDVSDPNAPSIIGSVNTPGQARDVALYGVYALVADAEEGLQVVDISNPESPQIIGSDSYGDPANSIFVEGDYAYIACGDFFSGGSFVTVDISNPSNPTLMSTRYTSGSANDVAVADGYAFVVADDTGLRAYSLTNPASPSSIWTLPLPNYPEGVDVADQRVYAATLSGGLHIVDIAQIDSPQVIGICGCTANSVAIVGDRALVTDEFFVATEFHGALQVFDVSAPALAPLVGEAASPGNVKGLVLAGDYAYLAAGASGLQIVDVSEPAAPVLAGSVDTPNNAVSVAVSGNHAFLACSYFYIAYQYPGEYYYIDVQHSSIQVVDVTNPATPVLVTEVETTGWATGVVVVGDFLYLTAGRSDLQIYDISDPTNPLLIASENLPGWANGLTVVGDKIYVAHACLSYVSGCDDIFGFSIVDISLPDDPATLGTAEAPGYAVGVAVQDNSAYLATEDAGVHVVDMAIPETPVLVASRTTPGSAEGIFLDENFCYVSDRFGGLHVFDISEPTSPTMVGTLDLPGSAWQGMIVDDLVYIAAGNAGLAVAWPHCAPTDAVPDSDIPYEFRANLAVSPNPFNPQTTISFSLSREERVRISVYDLAGRLINVLVDHVYFSGDHSVIWTGRDATGRAVPSGSYVVRLEKATGVAARKVSLIR